MTSGANLFKPMWFQACWSSGKKQQYLFEDLARFVELKCKKKVFRLEGEPEVLSAGFEAGIPGLSLEQCWKQFPKQPRVGSSPCTLPAE